MRRVIVPPSPGLVSAFGAVIADERVDRRVDRRAAPGPARGHGHRRRAGPSRRSRSPRSWPPSVATTGRDMTVITNVACRYLGQNYEQEVRMYSGPRGQVVRAGHRHRARRAGLRGPPGPRASTTSTAQAYGYDLPDQPIQSVYLGATAFVAAPPVAVHPYAAGVERAGQRTARDACSWRPASGSMPRSSSATTCPWDPHRPGPAIIEEPDSTTYVPPGFERRGASRRGASCMQATRGGADDGHAGHRQRRRRRPGRADPAPQAARQHLRRDGGLDDAHRLLADLLRGPRLLDAHPRPRRQPHRDAPASIRRCWARRCTPPPGSSARSARRTSTRATSGSTTTPIAAGRTCPST